MNKEISVYDNTVSARTYISYIAEQAGGFACIGRDGKLYIRLIGQSIAELPLKYFQNFKWGDKFKFTRVRYEDGIQLLEKGNTTENTIYINQDNMYIVDQEQIDNIYNQLNGLEVYGFEGYSIIDPALDVGDILIIDGKKVIYQGSSQYGGRFKANISSKIQCKSKEETTTRTPSQKVINRRVQSQINQAEGKITQLVEETTEQTQKITEVEQTVSGITQKVENIQDFTKEKTQNENLYLDDIAEGEGYILKFIVYGNTEVFTTRDITIVASKASRGYGDDVVLLVEDGQELLTENNQQFIIGQGAYYIKSLKITLDDYLRNLTEDGKEYCDTLEIEQDGTIKVVRRIGVNEQGDLYLLAKEAETIFEEKIVLPSQKDAKTYYFIKELSGLNYYTKYIIQNNYSKTFLSKLELGTKIEQNSEAVKVAWNQISDFIQMMIINNNASFAILDKDKKLLMSLDKTGQHFYEEDGTITFGEMGVQTEDKNQYIAFSIESDYEQNTGNGMAWGVKTKTDNKFHPIFYIKDFQVGPPNSDASYGELVLNSCDIILNGNNTGIISGNIYIHGNIINGINFEDTEGENNLLTIYPKNSALDGMQNGAVIILDKIKFFANQAGSNSFKIGDDSQYVLMTDTGNLQVKGNGSVWIEGESVDFDTGMLTIGEENKRCSFTLYSSNANIYSNLSVDGNVYADNISSDRRLKKNIKDSKTNAIDIIKQIKHKQFEMKKDGKHYNIGYIAQEMEKIDCNFVIKREKTKEMEERYYINELPIIATLSKAIQEQIEQIEQLQEKDQQKDEIIQNLLKRIEKLEGGK